MQLLVCSTSSDKRWIWSRAALDPCDDSTNPLNIFLLWHPCIHARSHPFWWKQRWSRAALDTIWCLYRPNQSLQADEALEAQKEKPQGIPLNPCSQCWHAGDLSELNFWCLSRRPPRIIPFDVYWCLSDRNLNIDKFQHWPQGSQGIGCGHIIRVFLGVAGDRVWSHHQCFSIVNLSADCRGCRGFGLAIASPTLVQHGRALALTRWPLWLQGSPFLAPVLLDVLFWPGGRRVAPLASPAGGHAGTPRPPWLPGRALGRDPVRTLGDPTSVGWRAVGWWLTAIIPLRLWVRGGGGHGGGRRSWTRPRGRAWGGRGG